MVQADSHKKARARQRLLNSPLRTWKKQELKALKGCTEARLHTPPLRELNEQTSLGYDVIEFAREVCGIKLLPWQEWLLIHALELADPWTVDTIHERGLQDQIFRFRKVIVLVARQNGKTTLGVVLALYCMFVLRVPELLGVAQDLDVAEEVLQEVQDIIEVTDELDEITKPMARSSGKKAVQVEKDYGGSRYKVKAANRKAGRGLTADIIFFDELREQQTWDAWGAVTKTTNARASSLVWCMSNAGDLSSVVLRYLRLKAHERLGDPDGVLAELDAENADALLPATSADMDLDDLDDLEDLLEEQDVDDEDAKLIASAEELSEDLDLVGFFEWSTPKSFDLLDPEGWRYANPSLGYTGLNGLTLASEGTNEPEATFGTENLCQWVESMMKGPFPEQTWEAGWWTRDKYPDEDVPKIIGPAKACLDIPLSRNRVYISLAGMNDRGRVQIELVAARHGIEWAYEWLREAVDKGLVDEITGQSNGSQATGFLQEAERKKLPVTKWEGPDLSMGTSGFYDAIVGDEIDHFRQPAVDMAAQRAVMKFIAGGAMLIDRIKSPIDVSPLMTFAGAHWLLTRKEDKQTSMYESEGLTWL